MPMNSTDPKVLRTHIRRPRNIKRRFSAALALWCAYRKRPAGGCAGAGTHLHRAAGRGRTSIGLAPSPRPAPLAGRRHGCPGPVLAGFTRIYTYAESGWNAAESRETGRSGSRARRDRPSKKLTPLPQRRRPHANQIKGRLRLVVRPQGVTARTPHRGRAAARCRSRCRARGCTGRHAALLLSSMPSFLCLLLSREARPCVFSMQCLLLEKRAGETTVFLNTIFLSKRNIGVVGT